LLATTKLQDETWTLLSKASGCQEESRSKASKHHRQPGSKDGQGKERRQGSQDEDLRRGGYTGRPFQPPQAIMQGNPRPGGTEISS
ncbi:MAG: hypothetical protein QF412_16045, partial [Planctomycetota bacterium]|nr:hypothetical protein [Planctomycetota bacterium]